MTYKDKWLVAVTAGKWQKHGIKEAKLAGLKVLAIDSDKNAEGFLVADRVLCVDLQNHDSIIKEIRTLGISICGAVSFVSEVGMPLTARIREEFLLPGPKKELIQRLINKIKQRSIWAEKGISGPSWLCFTEFDAALKAAINFNITLIIKPADSSGSRGVTKIESSNDNIKKALESAFKYSRSGEIIIESYMDGTEFTVETFASNGITYVLAITEKKKINSTQGTVAYELATPNRNSTELEKISKLVVQAYQAIEYTEGPGHAEVILMKDGSVGMVEVAGRGGGFMVSEELVPNVSGINVARLTALQAAGFEITDISVLKRAGVLRFFPSKEGKLLGMQGFELANSISGVTASPFVKIGDIFSKAEADGDRLGYLLSIAESPRKAQDMANKAEALIRFDFEDFLC